MHLGFYVYIRRGSFVEQLLLRFLSVSLSEENICQNLICATFQYNEKQVTATGLESTTSKEARFQNISVKEMLITYFKMFLAR